jgi:hypothetical protein
MTKDEFATLVEGDLFRVTTMPGKIFKVASRQTEFDYSNQPPTKRTWAIETEDGRYLKNFDREVGLAYLVPKSGDIIQVLESTNAHIPAGSLLLIHGDVGQEAKYFHAALCDRAILQNGYITSPSSDRHKQTYMWQDDIEPTYTHVSFPIFERHKDLEVFLMNGDMRLFTAEELPEKA